MIDGSKADAQASNDNGGNIARDAFGNGLPSQAYAKVGHYEGPSEPARFGYAQPAYYPIPAPATVFTYKKYEVPAEIPSQIVYEVPAPAIAQSSAVTHGNYGSANSNAYTGLDSAASLAQANGPAEPVVIAAKNQGLYTPYSPSSASSSANVNGGYGGSAFSAAKTGIPTRKSISWRFGTAYDQPAAYGAARAAANSGGFGLRSTANAAGPGSAYSTADNTAVKSVANSYNGGSADANANVNNGHYAVFRSENLHGYGGLKSSAITQNGGFADSKAQVDNVGNEYLNSAARSQLNGSAQSSATNDGGVYGFRSNGAWGGRTGSTAFSNGSGNAVSSVKSQDLSTGYRVINSNANSDAFGAARADAYSI